MKGILKCGLFGLLFAVSSIGLLGLLSDNASAASDWDNSVQLSTFPDSLTVTDPNGDNPIFIGDNWYDIAYNEQEGFTSRNRGGNTLAGARNKLNQLNDIVVGNTVGQYLWVHEKLSSGQSSVIVYFTNNLSAKLIPTQSGTYNFNVSPPNEWSAIMWYDTGYGRQVTTYNNTSNSSSGIPFDMTPSLVPGMRYLTLASDNLVVDYPVGYEGQIIEGTSSGDDTSKNHKPNITWSVNDKDVIVYSDDAKNTAVLEDYQIYWFISNTSFDTNQPSEPFALSGCTPPDYNNNFTVPIHFDYGIQAYYADEDCNILQVDDEGNRLTDNMVVLTIDGSTFDGSTTDHEAIIGEVEVNAILQAIRKFRPNDGGLAGLIYAPIEAVATLPTIVGSCSPITLPLLGEDVSLECIRPTIQASPMGVVYNTISVIITGIVTWWVAWRTFGTIKGIQDPQDDRVEVLKL